MRLIFMGTPSFAVTILASLQENGHEIVAVYTQPDRPKGRGKKIFPPPVKSYAVEHQLAVYQPQDLSTEAVYQQMLSHKADAAIVAAYGRILPEPILHTTEIGFINVHASILPAYRGAAPIQWAIRNGDKESGVSLMQMDAGMDTGSVYAIGKCQVSEDETSGTLFEKLANIGAELLENNLTDIKYGRLKAKPQNHLKASYAPMFKKEDERINWSMAGKDIVQLTRSQLPTPGTYSTINGQRIIFMEMATSEESENYSAVPGEVISVTKEAINVQTGQGIIAIKRLKVPGKNEMSVRDFLNGRSINTGMIFK